MTKETDKLVSDIGATRTRVISNLDAIITTVAARIDALRPERIAKTQFSKFRDLLMEFAGSDTPAESPSTTKASKALKGLKYLRKFIR